MRISLKRKSIKIICFHHFSLQIEFDGSLFCFVHRCYKRCCVLLIVCDLTSSVVSIDFDFSNCNRLVVNKLSLWSKLLLNVWKQHHVAIFFGWMCDQDQSTLVNFFNICCMQQASDFIFHIGYEIVFHPLHQNLFEVETTDAYLI